MEVKAPEDMEFGPFRLSVRRRRLLQNGQEVLLAPKAFDTLEVLVNRAGQLVEKQELMKAVWGDVFVEDSTLTQYIFLLRKALGEGEYIETVPRRGYRFVAPVVRAETEKPVPRPRLLWAGAAALAVLAGIAAWWAGTGTPDSIVVLPFRDFTPGNQMQYLADGLTEDLTHTLSSDGALEVIARTTAFHYQGSNPNIRELARQLNVGAVLEGSIRFQGDRIRVTAQLNNAVTGYHYWSRTFDRPKDEVYALSHDIVLAVYETLGGRLRIERTDTTDAQAYDFYLRGVAERQRTFGSDGSSSARFFEAAIEKDPSFAKAQVELAFAYLSMTGKLGLETAYRQAREALRRAMAMDPDLSMVRTVDGRIKLTWDWDVTGAIRELRRAAKLDPANAVAYHWLSHALEAAGQMEEAAQAVREAQRIEPHMAAWIAQEARHHVLTGRNDLAIRTARRALEVDPHNVIAPRYLRAAFAEAGQFDEAIQVMITSGAVSQEEGTRMHTEVAAGGAESFWRWNLKLWERSSNDPQQPYSLAQCYAHLGAHDAALRFLEEAFQKRAPRMWEVHIDPAFAPLRADPRFRELVGRMKLRN